MYPFKKPGISVVVLVHQMVREAPRTLYSLSTAYQQNVSQGDYEVVVVENPSRQMLRPETVRQFGRQFRHVVHPGDARSPAAAMNFGASRARGHHLMLMIDGARILSPGVLRRMAQSLRLYDHAVVATLAWHLGPDVQSKSIHEGYCQEVEDRLLKDVDWRNDGYRLFEISSLAGSCRGGWFGPAMESNCITVSRHHYRQLGGFCEQFQTDGGGFVNLDFFARAVSDPQRRTIFLLGEGTFHQVHGGAATNRANDEPLRMFAEEYQQIRGTSLTPPAIQPILYGHMPRSVAEQANQSILIAGKRQRMKYPSVLRPEKLVPSGGEPAPSEKIPTGMTVLGMHRSGTSCLAGTLMECGVYFGDVSRKNPHNTKGNNENRQIMDLQERLLTDNRGCWHSPPDYVLWNDEHRRIRNEIIRQYAAAGQTHWGFKDPRTLLTLDGWLEQLPDLRLVGIFRHPDAVAQSLTSRNLFSRQRGLELWYQYNRRLLAYRERHPFPVICFTNDPDAFREQLRQLMEYLAIDMPRSGFAFFEPDLQHHQLASSQNLPAHVADVYRQLQDIALADIADRPKLRKAA